VLRSPSLHAIFQLFMIFTGTEWGCADKVREGVTPNEHGTWQFGRMGWCDGQEVSFCACRASAPRNTRLCCITVQA